MAVYFDKLFDKIAEKGITQTELMQRIGASSATMTKMRNNHPVSLDILSQICEELDCDIGDIISCIPRKTSAVTNDNIGEINSIARSILIEYMKDNNLTPSDVAKITSLSLNTVKSFLGGNNISAASHIKLFRLGNQFNNALGSAFKPLLTPKPEKKIYCYSCGRRKNKCWAAQSIWKPEQKEYEHYCAFGFKQASDEDGKLYAIEDCPHPTTGREFALAKDQYKFTMKCEHRYIPAKNEK